MSNSGPHQEATNITRVAMLNPLPSSPVAVKTAGIIERRMVLHKYHPTVIDRHRINAVIQVNRIRVLVASCKLALAVNPTVICESEN